MKPGDPLPEFVVDPVSSEKMKTMAALLHDPNPIHWDREAVRQKGFGDRLINQGPSNLGYVLNMLMAWTGPTSIRSVQVRFTANVFDNDRVVAAGMVTAVRESGGETLVDCDVWLDRSDGTRAIAGTATVIAP